MPRSAFLLAAVALASPLVHAASLTWNDADANNTWDTTATSNWVGGVAWSNATPDSATFGGTGETVTLGTAITAGGLTFTGTGYTLTGSTLTLANNAVVDTGASDATVSSTLSATNWSKAGAGKLTLTTAMAASSTALTVNAGTVSLNGTAFNMLGNSGSKTNVILAAGATLSADSASSNAHNIGTLTLNGGTLTAGGTAANDGGYGNFILSGNVTVGGSAVSTISTKTFSLNGTRTFTVADSVAGSATDLNVSGVIISGSLVKEGAGTMTLSSAGGNTYAGATIVNNGVLQISAGGGYGGLTGGSAITVNNGGTLRTSVTNAISGNSVTVNAGGTVTVDANQVITMGNVTLAGGTLTGAGNNAYGNYFFNAKTITHTGDTTSTIDAAGGIGVQGAIIFDVADGAATNDMTISSVIKQQGTGTLTKNGAGRLLLSGQNTYTSTTTVGAGRIDVSGSIRVNGASGITVASGATLAITGALNLNSATDTIANSGSFIAGGTLHLNNVFDTLPATTTYALISGGSGGTQSGSFVVDGYSTSVFSNVSYNAATGVLTFTAVPEPSAYGLLGAGALVSAAIVRRRKKSA